MCVIHECYILTLDWAINQRCTCVNKWKKKQKQVGVIIEYWVERNNCRPRKDDMIPFPFNENWFSFFVADHLLVAQLCTNPKSDRSLLSFLKVTQCSMSEIRDAPLYKLCSLLIQVMTARTRDVPRVMKTKFLAMVMVFGMVSSEGHITPPHIFEVGLKVNTKVYLNVLRSVVIPWCNQVAGGRPWGMAAGLGTSPQVQRDPGLASEGVIRLCTLLSLAPLLLRPEPAGLLRLVIHVWEHHQHDLPQHQSQPFAEYLPSSPASAYGKGILPVPDLYWGGDWDWRRLHWIDVSSTTQPSYLNWFF